MGTFSKVFTSFDALAKATVSPDTLAAPDSISKRLDTVSKSHTEHVGHPGKRGGSLPSPKGTGADPIRNEIAPKLLALGYSRPEADFMVNRYLTGKPVPPKVLVAIKKHFADKKQQAQSGISKNNPYHAKDGKFTSGGGAATRSEGRGAVTEASVKQDKHGVDRLTLRSTIGGKKISLEMRQEVMDKIRNGELKLNPALAPDKWGAGGANPRREDFDTVNGYTPAADLHSKFGADSDAAKINAALGEKVANAWHHIENASAFDPQEAIHQGSLYKADQILFHANREIVPKLKLAQEFDGTLPAPIADLPPDKNHDQNFAHAKTQHPFEMATTIGSANATVRYSHLPGSRATETDPAAGAEIDYRAFLNEKGHPPMEIDVEKLPGAHQKLVEEIAEHHGKK